MNIQTPMNQTFAKLSLLALYHRIFSISRTFARMVYIVATFQIVWCIVQVALRLFQCTPIKAAYNPTIPGKCLNSQVLLACGESTNSFVDFFMIGMAVWMVMKLKMSVTSKVRLSILFAIGAL